MMHETKPRSLSGPVTVTLDFLDALQAQVALERRRYALRKEREDVATARRLLEVDEPSDDELILDVALAQIDRALAAIERACYGVVTESENRLLDGNR